MITPRIMYRAENGCLNHAKHTAKTTIVTSGSKKASITLVSVKLGRKKFLCVSKASIMGELEKQGFLKKYAVKYYTL